MLVSLQEMLSWLRIELTEITITANNNTLYFKYDGGESTAITLTSGIYNGDTLAQEIETQINSTFSSSATVSWSNNKFTIEVSGHTIQYIHVGSTAGYDIGFIQDSSAAESITSDIDVGDDTGLVSTVLTHCDKFVKSYCNREFESGSYTEIHDGGKSHIFVKEFPIISISRIAYGVDAAFSVNNTNETSYATVSCDGSSFITNLNGSTNELSLSTYQTIGDLVTAINNLGNGWVATLNADSYSDYLSSEILEFYGKSCLYTDSADVNIAEGSLEDFKINKNSGIITGYFPYGFQNIYISYTGGYTTIPEDLKMAVKILTHYEYNKIIEDNFGNKSYSIGDVDKTMFNDLPIEVIKILSGYKNYQI